uniref:Uncharacterized protein n=1 Tax=Lactuca sativa TaxID=4236 RepID=A0A9R1XSF2_LACSA|nr:hypothetical protein LSAT_V11C200077970 [Lactuca sativa]
MRLWKTSKTLCLNVYVEHHLDVTGTASGGSGTKCKEALQLSDESDDGLMCITGCESPIVVLAESINMASKENQLVHEKSWCSMSDVRGARYTLGLIAGEKADIFKVLEVLKIDVGSSKHNSFSGVYNRVGAFRRS